MTDRYHSLTVVLEKNLRSDDDAEILIAAIQQLKGVLSVKGHVADLDSVMAEERAKNELGKKLFNVIYPSRS